MTTGTSSCRLEGGNTRTARRNTFPYGSLASLCLSFPHAKQAGLTGLHTVGESAKKQSAS